MLKDLRITTFVPEDLDALRHHLQQCWRGTYAPAFGSSVAEEILASLSSPTLGDLVPQEDEIALIAWTQAQIAGCAVIAEREDTAYLWGMYVASGWQQKGVGRALVRHAANLVKNARDVQATVLAAPEPALRFYRALGFAVDERAAFELVPNFSVDAYIISAPVRTLQA